VKFVLEAKGLESDAWIRDYVRTTAVFAIWHHALRFEAVHVQLDCAREENDDLYVRCGIRAELPRGGVVSSGATGPDLCSAVQKGSHLLEAALYQRHRPAPGGMPVASERLAA
jgi:hypothetical protein